jgi:hypothetical protein
MIATGGTFEPAAGASLPAPPAAWIPPGMVNATSSPYVAAISNSGAAAGPMGGTTSSRAGFRAAEPGPADARTVTAANITLRPGGVLGWLLGSGPTRSIP